MKKLKARLAELLEERDKHLAIHPELRPLQKKLEQKPIETVVEQLENSRDSEELENIKDVIKELSKQRKKKSE